MLSARKTADFIPKASLQFSAIGEKHTLGKNVDETERFRHVAEALSLERWKCVTLVDNKNFWEISSSSLRSASILLKSGPQRFAHAHKPTTHVG